MEIVGTKGKLLLEDNTLYIWNYGCDVREYIKTEQAVSREVMKNMTEEVMTFDKLPEPYVDMLEEFAQAVLSGDDALLAAPGREAVNQLMLTNAAYYSAWKKQTVELPLDEEAFEAAFLDMCEEEKCSVGCRKQSGLEEA